ncbi:hypothetical protein RFI_38901 [Reticulomyxa filosa]|uniref:Uncharacterized protein n=1 Tax=Reticulomyxa filosa TaxID=46433 RepID=X6LBS4_RETFI|nr:hypothetical protein RFI_38901 [Reticulomyxa filosa]|eukprot:ETN98591.1 hypothetical protein RFI_38901 [Reticulomyxa filosa]
MVSFMSFIVNKRVFCQKKTVRKKKRYTKNSKYVKNKAKCNGGMQNHNNVNEGDRKYTKEIKTLVRLFGDSISREELQQKIEHHDGNIELVIKDLVQQSVEKEDNLEVESKTNELENTEQKQEQGDIVNTVNGNNKSIQKEMEKTEIGEIKPGINLQGYCSNESCLASKAKLAVWVNIGFENIRFISDKTSLNCPDCKKETVTYIIKAMFYNSEYSININNDIKTIKDNNYESIYSIKEGIIYELKANKIKQHAKKFNNRITKI